MLAADDHVLPYAQVRSSLSAPTRSDGAIRCDISEVTVVQLHPGTRGYKNRRTAPALGTLMSGEP